VKIFNALKIWMWTTRSKLMNAGKSDDEVRIAMIDAPW
jgi:hypothetical protein